MLDLLRTGRWLAFTATALAAIVVFGLLSLWQWRRAEEERAEFAPVQAALNATAVPLAAADRDWQRVTVTGRYEADRQFLVRNRPQDGSNGFQVVTHLAVPNSPGVWVVRGFLPATGAAAASAEAPAPPSGEVTVTGHLRSAETAEARAADDLPAGQVSAINTAGLDALAGVAPTGGWYVLATSDTTLQPVPLPQPTDTRNLSYAGQWLLFAAIVVGGWWYFLRREAHDDLAAEPRPDQPVAAGR